MRGRESAIGWSVWALATAMLITGIALFVDVSVRMREPSSAIDAELLEAYAYTGGELAANVIFWLAILAFTTLGALVLSRQPENKIGWLFCAIGMAFSAEWFTGVYAVSSALGEPLAGDILAAWVNNVIWVPAYGLLASVLPLTYPDGHLVSPRWRPVAWMAGTGIIGMSLVAALHSGHLFNFVEPLALDNPLGVSGLEPAGPVTLGFTVIFLFSLIAGAVSLFVRLRGSRGRRRDQLRWFAYWGAILGVMFVVQFLMFYVFAVSSTVAAAAFWILWVLVFLGLPLATGLAILHHRLYDIDRLINRTLVYGVLTVLLASVYGIGVLTIGALLGVFGLSGSSDLAVAASTLAVAAAFGPARGRLQQMVDRRFYRARYDATRASERLADRLRSEVDPNTVREDIIASVSSALRPSFVTIWSRGH